MRVHHQNIKATIVLPVLLTAFVISIRVFCLPICVNYSDSSTVMSFPVEYMGHWPPLYPAISALLKMRFGPSAAYLTWLMIIQYTIFGAAFVYFLSAFRSRWAQIAMACCVLINFHALIVVGGIMTESLAIPVLILSLGAGLRVLGSDKPSKTTIFVLGLSFVLAVLTRLPLACLMIVTPLSVALFSWRNRGLPTKLSLDVRSIANSKLTKVVAAGLVGLIIGQILYVNMCLAFKRPYSTQLGRVGVIVVAKCWNNITDSDRARKLKEFKASIKDRRMLAVLETILEIPTSAAPWHHWFQIYSNTNARLAPQGLSVSMDKLENLKPIDNAASKAFIKVMTHPDRYVWSLIGSEFLDHLQLSNLFIQNPKYSWSTMQEEHFRMPDGQSATTPKVPCIFLNRYLINTSGLSERWGDPGPIYSRLFSPRAQTSMLNAVNSWTFWFLDFFNPASEFVLLVVLLMFGTVTRLLSTATACLALATIISVLGYDLFHAIFQAAAQARYLVPSTLLLGVASGILLVDITSRQKTPLQPSSETVKEQTASSRTLASTPS